MLFFRGITEAPLHSAKKKKVFHQNKKRLKVTVWQPPRVLSPQGPTLPRSFLCSLYLRDYK
uniref:Uncharacterized protein n=1 Tax=Anguilla anguilla TaxID=7936 RepID=A0A0E9WHQ1_ANGAN